MVEIEDKKDDKKSRYPLILVGVKSQDSREVGA
jgi:hypothetical protein